MPPLRRLGFALTACLVLIVAAPLRADAPVLSAIAPVTIQEDTNSGPLAFTITDADTDPNDVTMSATSSNQAVVADGAILFAGTGASRTVSFQPVANASGTTTITLTANDGTETGTTTIDVTVTAVDDPPTISDIAAQITPEDVSTGPIPFTVGDIDTNVDSLALAVSSDDAVLLPPGSMVTGGTGANRTVTVTPAPGLSGSATVTVQVTDGTTTASDTFVLTVTPVNDPPTISDIGPQAIDEDTSLAPVAFTVGDPDTAPGSLLVSASSDNLTLVPLANITLGGSGANRTIAITPTADQSGTATITVTVSDGTTPVSDTFTLTVNGVNDPPTISDILAQTTPENVATGPIAFTIGDIDSGIGALSLSAGSDNLALVPLSNIVFGGAGPNRTVTVTPAANQWGSATITVTVSDGTASASDTFLLTVTGADDPPTISDIGPQAIAEDTSTGPLAFTIGDSDTALGSLLVSASSDNLVLVPLATITLGGSGADRTVTVTPAANQSGTATITVTVSDGTTPVSDAFVLTVNAVDDPPTISDIGPQVIDEDTSLAPVAFTVGDPDTPLGSLLVGATSDNLALVPLANIALAGSEANRTIAITPAPGLSGTATITVTVSDGTTPVSDTFVLTVTNVADPPTISDIGPQAIDEDTSLAPVAFTLGDPDTPLGSLLVSATSDNLVLVPLSAITLGGSEANRTIAITPAADQSGSVTITVTVSDGTTPVSDTFTLTVNGVNDPPTISDIGPQVIPEDTSTGPVAFTVGDPDTAVGTLIVTAGSDNPALVPLAAITLGGSGASRTITVVPAANQSGSATITVTVSDGTTPVSDTFVLTVNAVNDPPTITPIGDQSIDEDTSTAALPFTIGDAETAPEALAVSVSASDAALFPPGSMVIGGAGASRTVTLTPAAGRSGNAVITVSVVDGDLVTASTTFAVLVTAVDDPPTLAAIGPQVTSEDTPLNVDLTVGDSDTDVNLLVVSATSGDQALVPNTNLSVTGAGASRTLTIIPAPDRSGSATVTVTVADATGSAVRVFTLTVNAVNDVPTIGTIADQQTNEDTTLGPIAFSIGDVETPAGSLTVTAASSDQALVADADIVLGGSGASRTVTITPRPNATGVVTVTLTVSDGQASAPSAFQLTVLPVNDPPTISAIGPQTTAEDTPTGAIPFTVGDAETAAGSLVVSATSDNQAVLPNGNILLGGSGANRTITLTPAPNQHGTANVTVVVSDGQASANRMFAVTVQPVNDVPAFSGVPAGLSFPEDTVAGPMPFTVTDADHDIALVQLSVVSDNPALLPASSLALAGGSGSYTLTLTPVANASGAATVTITATDPLGASTAQIAVTVTPVNDPPTISDIGDSSTTQENATPPIGFTIGDIDSAVTCANVAASSSNTTLVPNANLVIGGSGTACTITAQPATGQQGTSTITVTVSDGALSAFDTFVLTVNPPNAPTVSDVGNQTIAEDTSLGAVAFTIGDTDTPLGNLTVSARSSDQALVPDAALVLGGSGAARTIAATPVANRNGAATITVTVRDGTGLVASDSFLLTVTKVNDTPTLTAIAGQATDEDTLKDVALTLGDVDLADTPPDTLGVTVTSSNTALVPNVPANLQILGSGTARTLRITPLLNQSGSTQITVTVTDAALATAVRAFTLNVSAINDAPTLAGVPTTVTFDEDTTTVISSIAVGDVETSAASLTLSVTSSNASLVPATPAGVAFGGSGASRTATITPVANAFGTATLTITVTDTGTPLPAATASSVVTVTVTPVNDAPVLSMVTPTPTSTNEDTALNVDYTLSDVDSTVTCAAGGSVSVTSTNVGVLPLSGVTFTPLSGSNCRVTVTPALNASGLTTVTLTASDGTAQAQRSFSLDVLAVNDAPTLSAIGAQATTRNTPTSPIAFTIGDVDDDVSGLVLSASSSNTSVVNNVATAFQFGGTLGSRTLVVTPQTNAVGSADITVVVRDAASAVSSRTFPLTVTAGTCSYVVTTQPTALTFPAAATTVIVDIESNCPWTVTSSAAWMTMPSQSGPVLVSSGQNKGAVFVTVGQQTAAGQRQGTLTVTGTGFSQALTVTQSGVGCSYALAPPATRAVPLVGGVVTFDLTAPVGCAWTASSNQAWAPITSGANGTASGTVTVTVAANSGATRTATVTIGGTTATIEQAGACSLTVSPLRLAFGAAGGSSPVLITTPSGCQWTASSGAGWVAVSSASGFGLGSIAVSAADNTGGAPRQATVTIALASSPATSQTIVVAQDSPTQGDADGDGLPSAWEAQFGLNATSEAGANGALGDPDGDGITNIDELRNGTHPRGFVANTRYLAEGASSAFFETRFALFNPGDTSAIVLMRFQRKGTTPASQYLVIPAKARRTVISTNVPEIANAEFSTLVEADAQVVVDRTLSWGSGRYGSHAETSVVSPRTTWYLAEGATHSNFDLFYLLQNPATTPAKVRVTFLLPVAAPIVKEYDLPPNSRDNIWVDLIPGLENTDVSAVIEVTQGPAILVERALYLTPPGGATFVAGHDASAVASPQTRWFLAEGATGDLFDEFILIANPTSTNATVRATFLLVTGQNIVKTYTVPRNSRFNIWVDVEDPALAQAEVSAIVESTNNVPIIVERAMWWPGPTFATWSEAHVSAGTTTTGTLWALAEGEQGGTFNAATYVLVANTSPRAGTARATLYFEDGTAPVTREFALAPSSRNNVDIGANFAVAGRRFSVVIESIGTNPVEVVVERAMYSDANGQFWAAGNNAIATKIR